MLSLNLFPQLQLLPILLKNFWQTKWVVAVFLVLHLKVEKRRTQLMLGILSETQSQYQLTGEITMVLTTCLGQRTSTFLNIAVHVGPKVQPPLLLTDSTYLLA